MHRVVRGESCTATLDNGRAAILSTPPVSNPTTCPSSQPTAEAPTLHHDKEKNSTAPISNI